MTYCKDCRTEFMVEADDPCPRCGRYLGGERMGQRAEVARPEQPAQPAAQQAPVPPPAAPAPEDASPRPAQQVQTPLDAAMQGCASLVLRWIPLIMVANVLLNELPEKNLLPPVWWAWAAALAIVIPIIFTFRKTFQAGGAGKGAAAGAIGADGGASVIARLVLLVLLAVPALIGFAGLVFEERNPYVGVLWLLYLSVFAPLVCCVFMPFDELDDLMRGHPWFCVIWLLWVFLATGLFLWGMSDPNTFRIFLSVFGGG